MGESLVSKTCLPGTGEVFTYMIDGLTESDVVLAAKLDPISPTGVASRRTRGH